MSVNIRRTASLLAVAALSIGAAGCGQSAAQDAAGARAAGTFDITGIDALAGEFPTGFEVQTGLSKTLSSDDVDPDTWHDRVWELLRDLPEDTLITAVDCHI